MCLRILLCLLPLLSVSSCSVFNDNLRPVERQSFYRSGQMGRAKLDAVIGRYEIRTVINLRGEHRDALWYQREVQACAQNGVAHHDLKWSMLRIPDPESLSALVNLIETAEKPVLVHCQAGVHRAGTASAVYQLMDGGSLEDAGGEFGLFFMKAPIGNLLELYDESKPFAQWVREDYPKLYAERISD